ncbi:hypothetical protein AFNJKBDN_CDS0029 [Halorubrum virus V_ICIS4]|nr:hypothetical protein AFNJKBDN_CDS0029 [Halorubrum virus V_ICIS4]
MIRTKSLPRPQTDDTLRDQRTQEGADWVSAPSSRSIISASDSASRGRGVLGRQVSTTTGHAHDGGSDE